MKKTVLITGSSSGIGRAAALKFARSGWNVVATMRNPEKEDALAALQNVLCVALDVTKPQSVKEAIKMGLQRFGTLDVVVNNAGFGLTGPFEGATDEQIRRQFETNVFGLMNVVREVLPSFRARKSGKVINISSMGGRIVFPYYSLYHATKWAVEGFSEALRFELEPIGIQVKIIEPGAIKTDFYSRSRDSSLPSAPMEYHELASIAFRNMDAEGANGSTPDEVAKVIFTAANDDSSRIRYAIGKNAGLLLLFRRLASDSVFASLVRKVVFRKARV